MLYQLSYALGKHPGTTRRSGIVDTSRRSLRSLADSLWKMQNPEEREREGVETRRKTGEVGTKKAQA